MPKLTRRRLLCATAPLAAAPLGAKLVLGGEAEAAGHDHEGASQHRLARGQCGDGARGDDRRRRARRRRPERPRRAAVPAARASAQARPGAGVHARRAGRGARDRPRGLLSRMDVQRDRPRPRDPGHRGRRASRQVRERRCASAHDPLPRDPPDGHGRRLRDRRARRALHVRVPGAPGRVPRLPLSRDAAQEAHPQGPLRRLHHRPEGAARAGPRARARDERLRHGRRRREQLLHRQRPDVLLRALPDPRPARASSCGSTSRTSPSST